MQFVMSRVSKLSGTFTVLCFATILAIAPNFCLAQANLDILFDKAAKELNLGPDAAKATMEKLASLEPSFSRPQRARYLTLLLSSYAFRGMYTEQVAASEKALLTSKDVDQRANLLYYLADGYANLGEYEKALHAMNDSVMLLPELVDPKAKMGVLQSAISLLNSLHAFDESVPYAERLASLPLENGSAPACLGTGDLVEIALLRHDRARARELLPKAIKLCDDGGFKIISLSVKAMDAVDRLESGNDTFVMQESLALLSELAKVSERSDYSIQLADAIARRYLSDGQPVKAEIYASRAVQWANQGNAALLRQQTNETMAGVLRAQGKLDQAIGYLDISRSLWSKLLEERSKKDLAYQRVKYQAQDQSMQVKLLSQINKLLTSERELQERNKRSLELLVLVTGLLLAFVVVWLMRTWRQKNDFRTFSQIDGLTKVSNRTHLIACATEAFNSARGSIAVIIFDMDEFKQINDNFSHATGDWVLKTVSATVSACLRSHDLFGRFGGEEFAICLTVTSEDEAMALAERCRSAIAAIDSSPSGLYFAISASFGVAVRPTQSMTSFEETLARADQALYRAKRLGRNQVASHGPTLGGFMSPQPA